MSRLVSVCKLQSVQVTDLICVSNFIPSFFVSVYGGKTTRYHGEPILCYTFISYDNLQIIQSYMNQNSWYRQMS